MKLACLIRLGLLGYVLYRLTKKTCPKAAPSDLGMVATTERNTTVYDSPRPGQSIAYFNRFNRGARDAYYAGNDISADQQLALAQMALNNITSEDVIRLGGKFEDTLEKLNPITLDSPVIIPGDMPPPPPF